MDNLGTESRARRDGAPRHSSATGRKRATVTASTPVAHLSDERTPDIHDVASDAQAQGDISPAEVPDHDRIAIRAYERFQTRGGDHGRDQDDWFEAERELIRFRDE
jgi:hypothetical protein